MYAISVNGPRLVDCPRIFRISPGKRVQAPRLAFSLQICFRLLDLSIAVFPLRRGYLLQAIRYYSDEEL